jgi:16S rRNA (guanine527-N7)-methyltransferase
LASADALTAALSEAQARGFIGPAPIATHLEHARTFGAAIEGRTRWLDLGSGGGLPGLVLAVDYPETAWTLLDSAEKRTVFLASCVASLDLGSRVTVHRGRAEDAGRDPGLRERFDGVVARSFGPPAVTAECGAPFLRVGGVLAVSEPPEAELSVRWPAAALAVLGLERRGSVEGRAAHITILELVAPIPADMPRRNGVPAKQPLF